MNAMSKRINVSPKVRVLALMIAIAATMSLGGLLLLSSRDNRSGAQLKHDKPPLPGPPGGDHGQNFAVGDVKIAWIAGQNCKTNVRFAASSQPDGSSVTGTIEMVVLPGQDCRGQLTGRLTCLIVTGNQAVFAGEVTAMTDNLAQGNLVFGTVTENSPRSDGKPVDQAFFGMAGAPPGAKTCPPPLGPGNGPTVLEGSVRVH
jgi:hypothetical protein